MNPTQPDQPGDQKTTEFVTRNGAHEHRYINGPLLRWIPSNACTLDEFKRRCEADSQKLLGTPAATSPAPKTEPCFNCNGGGKLTELPYDECWVCAGTGRLPLPPAPEPHFFEEGMLKPTCRRCGLPKSASHHRPIEPQSSEIATLKQHLSPQHQQKEQSK